MKKVITIVMMNLILIINLIGCSNNNTELQKQSSQSLEKLSVVASSDEYKVDIKMPVDENNNPIIDKKGTTAVTIISNNLADIHDMFVSFTLLDSNNNEIDDDMYTNWRVSAGKEQTLNLNLVKFNSDGCHVEVKIINAIVDNDSSSTSNSNYSSSTSSSNKNSSQSNDKTLRSGQSIVLNKDELVCSSKENLDKLLSFINQKNKDGENQMLLNGQATFLRKGTKLNVIDGGIAVTEIETSTGEHWFTTRETIQDAL